MVVQTELLLRPRTLAEVTQEVSRIELAHMMVCHDKDCRRCADETPPVKKARRYLSGK